MNAYLEPEDIKEAERMFEDHDCHLSPEDGCEVCEEAYAKRNNNSR